MLAGYDAVLHLVTCAKGAEFAYNFGNVARYEDVETARRMDDLTLRAWSRHPNLHIIDNSVDFDDKLNRALYKALQASGMKLENYGTVFVTISDEDKEEALPLIRRFYRLGFNIEATVGTAVFLRQHGIKTRVRAKVDDGSDEILNSIRQGYVTYVINTMDVRCEDVHSGSSQIRRCAVENGVTMLTALDTVRVLLDVLEETTLTISTIDAR